MTFDEAVELAGRAFQELTDEALQDNHLEDYAGATPRDRECWLSLVLIPPQDRAKWDAVNRVAQWHLRSGTPMPCELAEWVADRLDGKRRRPVKRGPRPKTMRDRVIVSIIRALVDRGFRAARNSATNEHCSACDVVDLVRDDISYDGVAKVWNDRSKPESEDASLPDLISQRVERLFLSYEKQRNT